MTESGQVIVDSNIIIDIAGESGDWTEWSMQKLHEHTGGLLINPIVYAELCSPLDSVSDVDNLVAYLGLKYLEIPKEALFQASQAFLNYRKRGGAKTSPLPDFFIGAHAAVLEIPILTRDVARYRTYFPTVELICP